MAKRGIPVLKKPGGNFCPGCGHNIFHRLICEVIEELGYENNQMMCFAIGCACNHAAVFNGEYTMGPHGRPASVATGVKRTNREMLVTTYQGDGDAYVIGLQDTFNAAYRNERITQFVVNNPCFAMTGGQMGWTTLPGQKTATSQTGRDTDTTGDPLKFPELVRNDFGAAYAARGAVHNPKEIRKTKGYIRQALEAQIAGEGYSVVEVVSICPTNWHMSVDQSIAFLENEVLGAFELGEIVKRRGE
jgi:2-oxoglutarate ferredoxin oxidoreductase subunit beta